MTAASDANFRWADRAAQRGVALAFVSNAVLTFFAWPRTAEFYDLRWLLPTAGFVLAAAGWFILQTLRERFRRPDTLFVAVALIVALLVVAVTPTHGPSPDGWTWTQSWAVSAVCGVILLQPRRQAVLLVLMITVAQWKIRLTIAPAGIGALEAVIPIVGALITAWAARLATHKYDQAGAALRMAARTEEQVAEAAARAEAHQWWNRILHDKVLGALLLTSRATSPKMLEQARHLAGDALATMSQIEHPGAESAVDPMPGQVSVRVGLEAAAITAAIRVATAQTLNAGLQCLVSLHGLTPDLTVRGRVGSAPQPVVEAVLAAADQALRNVAEHSGQRSVWIRAIESSARVRVEIRDNGRGFDTRAVEERRLGLRSSIPGHMALVDGSADVTSRPGHGTTVTLAWAPDGSEEQGATLSAEQLRRWWWVSGLFVGLHMVGGLIQGPPLVSDSLGWFGVALVIVAYGLIQGVAGGRALVVGEALILVGSAMTLWGAPRSLSDGWSLWFLGACHPALVIPALRGRPVLSIFSGTGMAAVIVGEFALTSPEHLLDSGQLALPFVIIPTVAALYAVMLGRADARLRGAQATQARARGRLAEAQARQGLVDAQVTMLAPGTLELLQRLVDGELITQDDRESAMLMEAANRDHLVAADVLNEEITTALGAARARGVIVHLTSTTPASREALPFNEHLSASLSDFRTALIRVASLTVSGDELTARWQPNNSYAAGTIIVESEMGGDKVFEVITPTRIRDQPLAPRASHLVTRTHG